MQRERIDRPRWKKPIEIAKVVFECPEMFQNRRR